jgi:hypothetical protein
MKVLRKTRLFGFGAEGVGAVDGGGMIELGGGGGGRGIFSGRIVEVEIEVAGVGFELGEAATAPGGGGSDVLGLADPGRTTGFESEIEGLSA